MYTIPGCVFLIVKWAVIQSKSVQDIGNEKKIVEAKIWNVKPNVCPKILKQQTGIVKHVVINMAPCISGIIHILKFVRRMNKKLFFWKKNICNFEKFFAKKTHIFYSIP